MPKNFVVNASPLIVLGKIGLLDLLPKLANELVIPKGVQIEIEAGSPEDPARKWINSQGKVFVKDVGQPEIEILKWDLGLGETEVLSLAYRDKSFVAIVDDRAARRCAKVLDIETKGTLALLVLAKKEGLLPEITSILDRLLKAGFRLSRDLLETAKRLAGE